jgi:hypothetical protein
MLSSEYAPEIFVGVRVGAAPVPAVPAEFVPQHVVAPPDWRAQAESIDAEI